MYSIGMPVYNGERHIRFAIDTLLEQDFDDFELIITDNGSSDATVEICQAYAARDGRIICEENVPQLSPVENFNRALAKCHGRYFMWAAHDDTHEPAFVSTLVRALEANPRAVVAWCKMDAIDDDGNYIRDFSYDWGRTFARPKFLQLLFFAVLDEHDTQKDKPIYGLFRRETLASLGGMHQSWVDYSGEDIVTVLRVLCRGEIRVVPRRMFHYRKRNPVTRGHAPAAQYAARRLLMTPAVWKYILRNFVMHAHMSKVALSEAPLPVSHRVVLAFMIHIKGLLAPVKVVPQNTLREMGITKGWW